MKKLKLLFALLISLIVFSCSNDDGSKNEGPTAIPIPKEGTGMFTVEGTEYLTPLAYIAELGANIFQITISNAAILYAENVECNFSNDLTQGASILFTSPSSTIETGTYDIDSMTIVTNANVTDNCITSGDLIESPPVGSGQIDIQVSGNVYVINYSLITAINEFGIINGNYEGEPTKYKIKKLTE